jgi:Glycosyl hydrolases family 2, sugar binding domain/Glycosyl hydrolases family 2, TIM barrel domain/Glycosyl hydrolases family 2
MSVASTLVALLPLAMAAAQPTPPTPATPSPWKPVPGHIMTKWAADVSPDKAWPEYPRPQMVRERWMNLNGLWGYTVTAPGKPEGRGQILVPFPFESALSGVAKPLDPAATLTYRRSFTLPRDWSGQNVLLHFGAVDWKAKVSVNGQQVGEHTGGYDPFFFDITKALRDGPNEIMVEVADPTDSAAQPIGKQRLKPESIWYTSTSGIWQTVWLEPVDPAGHVERVHIATNLAGDVVVDIDGLPAAAECRIEITEGDRRVAAAPYHPGRPGQYFVPNAKLWTPDSPFLYTLQVTVKDGARTLDTVTSYFAFREVKVLKDSAGANRLMLNRAPLFQFGPLDQGFWPDGLYTPPTDEAMKEDILAVKRMGGNMLRKHVKVEPDRFYYWCDKLGVMVWQDMPSPFPPKNAEDAWKKTYEEELHRMIDALKDHPSIVMWVPFNEGWGQHDTAETVAKVKQWDPTRLINNASGWTDAKVGSVSDIHVYPGPGAPAPEPDRACVLGEFGGLGLPLEGHTWATKANWGYVSFKDQNELTDAYVGLLDRIPALIAQGLCAAVYTQTTDVEIECNGWLTYDRAVWKIDTTRAALAAKQLYQPPGKLRVVLPDAHNAANPGVDPPPGVVTSWRYTLEKPERDWTLPDFDDSTWREGKAGFGSQGTPGAIIGTEWTGADIWLRRKLEYDGPELSNPHLSIHHDEDAEVYINGRPAARLKGYTTAYTLEPISELKSLLPGRNRITLAVHCHQTRGGQYIDVGIVNLMPAASAPRAQPPSAGEHP